MLIVNNHRSGCFRFIFKENVSFLKETETTVKKIFMRKMYTQIVESMISLSDFFSQRNGSIIIFLDDMYDFVIFASCVLL